MKHVTEFFYIMLGSAVFMMAIASYNLLDSAGSANISSAKTNAAEDNVFDETSIAVSDETILSKDELVANLMTNPGRNLTIQSTGTDGSAYIMKIYAGNGVNNRVVITNNTTNSTENSIIFGKDRWDANQLDLDLWLGNTSFQMKPITNTSGGIKSIYYKGK